jgi:hypothetical protein
MGTEINKTWLVLCFATANGYGCSNSSEADTSRANTDDTTSVGASGETGVSAAHNSSGDENTTSEHGTTADSSGGSSNRTSTDSGFDSLGSTSTDASEEGSVSTGLSTDENGEDGDEDCHKAGDNCCNNTCEAGLLCGGEQCSCAVAGDSSAGDSRYTFLRSDGTVWVRGTQQLWEQIVGLDTLPITDFVGVGDGGSYGCGLRDDATVWCWTKAIGGNALGQLGNGAFDPAPLAHVVFGPVEDESGNPLNDVVQITVNQNVACAQRVDATLHCWGRGDKGQMGDGSTENRPYAAPVPNLYEIAQVAVSQAHACSLSEDHTVMCWGENTNGQFGVGFALSDPTPPVVAMVDVPGTAIQVDVGTSLTCVLNDEGAVWCSGSNSSNQLGNGSPFSESHVAVPVREAPEGPVIDDFLGFAIANQGVYATRGEASRVHYWGLFSETPEEVVYEDGPVDNPALYGYANASYWFVREDGDLAIGTPTGASGSLELPCPD